MTWDGRDVWRDEDGPSWTDNDDRDRVLYGSHPYDPQVSTHVEGGEPWPGLDWNPCPRCHYDHKPEDGCECKSSGCLGRTDSDGFCSRCGFTRPIRRAA
jgi:hypothetical protein